MNAMCAGFLILVGAITVVVAIAIILDYADGDDYPS